MHSKRRLAQQPDRLGPFHLEDRHGGQQGASQSRRHDRLLVNLLDERPQLRAVLLEDRPFPVERESLVVVCHSNRLLSQCPGP